MYYLDLKKNEFSSLPSLDSLILLILSDKKLKLDSIRVTIRVLARLRVLQLESNQLKQFPLEICKLLNLEELSLIGNTISELPSITDLDKLKVLDLSDNKLVDVPTGISQLTSLQVLNLSRNQFTSLTTGIGNLSKLVTLRLDHNNLKTVPSGMGELHSLKKLNLNNNELIDFPEEICTLPKLEVLEIDNNRLTSLPEKICKLTNLRSLSIVNNCLTNFPNEIGKFERLRSIDVRYNPIPRNELKKLRKMLPKGCRLIKGKRRKCDCP